MLNTPLIFAAVTELSASCAVPTEVAAICDSVTACQMPLPKYCKPELEPAPPEYGPGAVPDWNTAPPPLGAHVAPESTESQIWPLPGRPKLSTAFSTAATREPSAEQVIEVQRRGLARGTHVTPESIEV